MGIVVKTQLAKLIKQVNSEKGYIVKNVSDDFLPVLNSKVKGMVADAVERAHANNRRTIMGRDL